jgi:hypothetical protein
MPSITNRCGRLSACFTYSSRSMRTHFSFRESYDDLAVRPFVVVLRVRLEGRVVDHATLSGVRFELRGYCTSRPLTAALLHDKKQATYSCTPSDESSGYNAAGWV